MTEEIKFAYLKNHPLFSSSSDEKIREAVSMMKTKTVYRGETINYGDTTFCKVFLLIQGKVKIASFNEESQELIKDILTAPDIFGDLGMNGNPVADEYAEALTANTIICSFTSSELTLLFNQNPSMAIAYANMVSSKLRKIETRHADLVYRDAKSRLVRFIKNWAYTDGQRMGDKIVLNNYLTHTDIANVIATSRQSVNVLLNELRDSGFIFYNRKKIEISNTHLFN
jgi:CRP/FNR family transcriptional regulator, cyclic AMP receptor protein